MHFHRALVSLYQSASYGDAGAVQRFIPGRREAPDGLLLWIPCGQLSDAVSVDQDIREL